MTSKRFLNVLTADGEYVFPENHVPRGILQVTGTFDGATVSPGYDDGEGNFVAFTNSLGAAITATVADGWEVFIPASGKLAVKITNDGAGTSLKVRFSD